MQNIYHDTILRLSKEPRNYGVVESPTHDRTELNMLCGDEVRVTMRFAGEKNVCEEIRFTGYGCAVMKASASTMTDLLAGCTAHEIKIYAESFHTFLHNDLHNLSESSPLLIFEGVRQFPARIKCAWLPWKATLESMKSEV